MTAGIAGFVTNDMFVKLASESLPTGQIIVVRGVIVTSIMLLIASATGAIRKLAQAVRPAVGLRTFGEVASAVLFLNALFHMPFANALAITQSLPFIFTVVAALYLGERVGWRRWLAVCAGLLGLLLIVRPGGEGFNVYALLAVASLAFMVLRDLATRRIPIVVPTILIALVTSFFMTATGAVLGLAESWLVLTPRELLLLVGAAAMLTAGYFFTVDGLRHGEISAVVPFRYTALIWGILYGIVIWDAIPDALAIFGMALIVGSGLVVYHRERRLSQSR